MRKSICAQPAPPRPELPVLSRRAVAARDDDFTISFSFTKQACRIPGDYEFLFSSFGECTDDRSDQSKPRCTIADGTAPGIHIFLVRKVQLLLGRAQPTPIP